MAVTDIAQRVYDHTWKLDPIVRSHPRHGFLQAPDAADDPGPLPGRAGDVLADQPHPAHQARRGDRRAGAARPARPCAHHPPHQEGADLARRQHLLRPPPDFRPGVPGLVRRFPAAGIRADARGRAVRARIRRAVDAHLDVGDPGACHHQRAALARGAEEHGALRARRPLRARQGEAVGPRSSDLRALPESPDLGFRHAPPAQLPVAALVRRGAQGGAGRHLLRHEQRAARHGQRPRGDRHQRARAADGAGGAGNDRRGAALARHTACCRTGSAITAAIF